MTQSQFKTQTNQLISLEIADTFFKRFCGLMLRKGLAKNHGLYLAPCASIHMMFMRFAIDAVYVDKDFTIQKIARHLRPWIGCSWCPGAHGVIELPSGTANALSLEIGQKLIPEETSN
ncbi:DUF192 domain-containing protein [Selenomonas sp.]|uniref:DUF192 domain-containing protein n=1 Tax=Selenomonas sp. TaxID=2053611 RepID=UPI0025D7EF26|nr:DUF192 domain-containing protein [Selenomonas sp.]MDY3297495.1 DUF192 domain-containing protein [Selenomonas sp.]